MLLGGGSYVLIGQYTSGALDNLEVQLGHGLNQWTRAALDTDSEPALDLPTDLRAVEEHVGWLLASNGGVASRSPLRAKSEGDDTQSKTEKFVLEVPDWVAEGRTEGHFLTPDGPVLASIERRDDRIAAAWIPLDAESSRAVSRERWFEARFLAEPAIIDDRGNGFNFGFEGDRDGGETGDDELFESELIGEGWWGKRWIFFMHLSPEPHDWDDGRLFRDHSLTTLLTTSPSEGVAALFSSPFEIGAAVSGVLMLLASLGAVVYLGTLTLAIMMMFTVTRSTSRLTTGTHQVEGGNLDYRIPVHRHDQLGDLAKSFNEMTASVQSMLADVADKERMRKELELAREIQLRLLPAATFDHGTIKVRAHFQPADEVGGDYFDIFPLDRGKLIVAVGDVAGHGLPTGLLMAMLKSAVATLVREGHRGPELLERLNNIMLEQPRGHRMVTLAVAEVDLDAGTATITNAAHPPLFLTGQGVREVMLPALPVGFPWRQPPPSSTLELEAGARLIFYSDGLVEACNQADEPFGYERLQALLGENLELPTEELLNLLLNELSRHTGGRALDDDLTVVIIDGSPLA